MRIFIAEDEPLAAAKLKLFLDKLGEGQDVTHFSDGLQLSAALNNSDEPKPDLLFMDIQMPNMTGLDVLKQLGESTFPIILTTAFDQYALDGFNFGVTDYLLKPYTLERLKQALQKARRMMPTTEDSVSATAPQTNIASISVRCEGRNELVEVANIESLEALKDYTRLTLTDGRQLTTLGTLTSMEQQLPSETFIRVQRSYVVNLKRVQSYNMQSLRLVSGIEIPIGKTYREEVHSSLSQLFPSL